MLKLFLVGIVTTGSQAFLHIDRPIHVAGQALENAADVGSGLVSAAADAAAVTAGLGAHLAGRTAAEAGALAAAASGMSAASTLMGDVLGGQIALGADVVSALVPRPFQHLHNLAALGLTGITSGAAGFTAGNTLGYALGHHHNLPISPYFPFVCGPFMTALFGLKPAHMPQEVFFDTVRGVIDKYYIDDEGNFAAASPVEFVDRLRDAWVDEYTLDVPNFGAVARDLTLASARFPWLGTPLFLKALHEVCEHLRSYPWPLLPWGPYLDKEGWSTEAWNGPLSHLWDAAWSHIHKGYSDGHWDEWDSEAYATNYRTRPGIDTASAQKNSQPVTQQAYNIFDTTVVAGPNSLIGDTTVTASIDNKLQNDQNANQNASPVITAPLTVGTIEAVGDQAPEIYPFPPGVPLYELPTSVGCVTIPGYGTFHLSASAVGELSFFIPEFGTLPVTTMSTGQAFVTIPGVGTIPVNPFTTMAVAHVPGFGDVGLRIDTRGYFTVDLPQYGRQPVYTTVTGGLAVNVPGIGELDVDLLAPARALVHVPGHGTAALTVSTAGTISVTIQGLGSIPVVANVDGTLTVFLPRFGTVRIQGVALLDGPVPVDYLYLPEFGYFPVTRSFNGTPIVTVHGLGTFPVMTNSSGSYHVVIPRHGTFPIVSVVLREDARDTESAEEEARAFEHSHDHTDVVVPFEPIVPAEPVTAPATPVSAPATPATPVTTIVEPYVQRFLPPPVYPAKHGHHHGTSYWPMGVPYGGAIPFAGGVNVVEPAVAVSAPTEIVRTAPTVATTPVSPAIFRPPPVYPVPVEKHGHHHHGGYYGAYPGYPWGSLPWGPYETRTTVVREPTVTVREPVVIEPVEVIEPAVQVEPTTILPREAWTNGWWPGFPGEWPGDIYPGFPGDVWPGYPGAYPVEKDHHHQFFDGHHLNKWIWSLSDAAVYFLQKLDVFRPAYMAPEKFLMTVNQTIIQLQETRDWKHLTPLKFIRHLGHKLGGWQDIPTIHIESIGEHVASSLEGPFPPFPQILEHISEVITQKLADN